MVTWAAAIVGGFDGAPGLCPKLNFKNGNGAYAYEVPFRNAVREAVPNCVIRPAGEGC
jgi:hypothetical protein